MGWMICWQNKNSPPEFPRFLSLLHKLRLEAHCPKPFDLAVDIVVAIGEADVLDLGSRLDWAGRALHGQVFDHDHGIAVGEDIAVGVLHYQARGLLHRLGGVPFMATFGAGQQFAGGIGIDRLALWAGWEFFLLIGHLKSVVVVCGKDREFGVCGMWYEVRVKLQTQSQNIVNWRIPQPPMNPSFFQNLETAISRGFTFSRREDWQAFWCEAIVPQLSLVEDLGEGQICLEAEGWLGEGYPKGHFGFQHRVVLQIFLSANAADAFRAGQSLEPFIPDLAAEDWMEWKAEEKRLVVWLRG